MVSSGMANGPKRKVAFDFGNHPKLLSPAGRYATARPLTIHYFPFSIHRASAKP